MSNQLTYSSSTHARPVLPSKLRIVQKIFFLFSLLLFSQTISAVNDPPDEDAEDTPPTIYNVLSVSDIANNIISYFDPLSNIGAMGVYSIVRMGGYLLNQNFLQGNRVAESRITLRHGNLRGSTFHTHRMSIVSDERVGVCITPHIDGGSRIVTLRRFPNNDINQFVTHVLSTMHSRTPLHNLPYGSFYAARAFVQFVVFMMGHNRNRPQNLNPTVSFDYEVQTIGFGPDFRGINDIDITRVTYTSLNGLYGPRNAMVASRVRQYDWIWDVTNWVDAGPTPMQNYLPWGGENVEEMRHIIRRLQWRLAGDPDGLSPTCRNSNDIDHNNYFPPPPPPPAVM